MRSVAVVGASLAGLRAVEALRRIEFTGDIHLIGAEERLPYDRPPLSKQVLSGEWEVDRTALITADEMAGHDVTLHLGDPAVALDAGALLVTLASGRGLDVDGIIIATGARPRRIETDLAGVHTLRTVDDALAIAGRLDTDPRRVAVIGGGFIGAEVAATARQRGAEVTVVESLPTPFETVLGPEVGAILAEVHRRQGVELRCGVGCVEFQGRDRVEGVVLTDGDTVEADLVVVGIGVIPNVEWLKGSGLTIDDGVVCDETLLAGPGIVAVGDVARWRNRRFDESMRVEHWDNAVTSAQHGAKRLVLGEVAGPFEPVPWFWSDQYDYKLQLAGRTTGFDRFEMVVSDQDAGRFVGLYGQAGQLSAVVGINRPRHVMRHRAMIESGVSFDEALAAEV